MPRTTAQQAIATVRRDGPIWDDHANVRALLAYLTIETYGGPGHPTYVHVLTWIVQLDPITVAASCPTARGCPPPQPGIAQVAIDATTGKYLLGRTFGAAHPPAGRQYAGAPLTTDQAADAEWDQP
jgi:hypothetical protein